MAHPKIKVMRKAPNTKDIADNHKFQINPRLFKPHSCVYYSINVFFSEFTSTANVNSQITDNLRYLLVVSKQTHIFLDIFENCYNHRQMSVKIKIKSYIHQKN